MFIRFRSVKFSCLYMGWSSSIGSSSRVYTVQIGQVLVFVPWIGQVLVFIRLVKFSCLYGSGWSSSRVCTVQVRSSSRVCTVQIGQVLVFVRFKVLVFIQVGLQVLVFIGSSSRVCTVQVGRSRSGWSFSCLYGSKFLRIRLVKYGSGWSSSRVYTVQVGQVLVCTMDYRLRSSSRVCTVQAGQVLVFIRFPA